MPTFSVAGRTFITKVFTATTGGVAITLTVPVKTITLKPRGGSIRIKRNSTDADADGFYVDDGESLSLDLSLPYSADTATFGTAFTDSGSVSFFVIAGF